AERGGEAERVAGRVRAARERKHPEPEHRELPHSTYRSPGRSAATGRGRHSRDPVAGLADGDDTPRAEATCRLERDQPRVLAAELAAVGRAERELRRDALLRRCHGIGPADTGVARRLADEVGPGVERQVAEQY